MYKYMYILLKCVFCCCFFQESLKVEMGIMEAKFESAQRTLEAELASQMEKEVSWIIQMQII